jgi:hypothetical protein
MFEKPEDVDYTVLLVFPGFGEERENAEEIIEAALQHLNTEKDEPGMRFAYNVFAHLEIVADVDQARDRLDNDDTLVLMILHDLSEDERDPLTRECMDKEVLVCHTFDVADRPRPRKRRKPGEPWKVVFNKPKPNALRAHTICGNVLTDPLDAEPEEMSERVGQLICVMALSVMENHWRRNPPKSLQLMLEQHKEKKTEPPAKE